MTASPHLPDDPARPACPDAPVTVVIIAGDEATAISRCLESAAWAAEIVVVCSGSDTTAEIARRYTSRVYDHLFQGHAAQRVLALSYARAHGSSASTPTRRSRRCWPTRSDGW